MAEAVAFAEETLMESSLNLDMDKLSYEIFSILEAKFLFDSLKPSKAPVAATSAAGKVRILSIDAAGATQGLLAASSLSLLESSLRHLTSNPDARVADFFDVAAGSGSGGVLSALLFSRGPDSRPLFSADQALRFLLHHYRHLSSPPSRLRRLLLRGRESRAQRLLRKTFSDLTLKDTLKPLLVPCYDALTGAPFLFSRADSLETDGFDFKLREVCHATCAAAGPFQMWSLDGRTKIAAVDAGVAMSNPSAAAITHVLNNKQEFPFCRGVEDLLVASLGNGESHFATSARRKTAPAPEDFVRIAGEGVSDMVDQAVSMAFGEANAGNYVRIQGNGLNGGNFEKGSKSEALVELAEEMLKQKNVESILFRGKKIAEKTNAEKMEYLAKELINEKERRKLSLFPTVVFKQATTPRTSSATTSSC